MTRSPATPATPTSVNITHDAGTLTITKSADAARVGHGGTVTYTFVSPTRRAPTARRPTAVVRVDRPGLSTTTAPGLTARLQRRRHRPRQATSTAARRGLHVQLRRAGRPRRRRGTTRSSTPPTLSGTDLDGDPVTGDTSNTDQRRRRPRRGHARHRQERRRTTSATAAPSPTRSMSPTPRAPTARRPGRRRHRRPVRRAPARRRRVRPTSTRRHRPDGYLDGGETWKYTCTYTVAGRHSRTARRTRSSTPPR